MKCIKNYISLFSLVASSVLFSQTTPDYYKQMYDNQQRSQNTIVEQPIAKSLTPKEIVDEGISRMMTDPVLRNAQWGFVIYDPKTKKIVNSYNEMMPLIPASTTKLLTTDTALDLLGGRFQWTTLLEYSGSIDEAGTLNGNLYIVGSGDPSIGTRKAGASSYSEIVSSYLSEIKAKGIRKIAGDIIVQTAVFKDNKLATLPENIVWLDFGNYYLPAGRTRDIDPRKEKAVIKKKSPMGETKHFFYISPYTHKMVFTDEFEGNEAETKIADAPNFLANSLKTNLVKGGISVTGKVIAKMIDANPEERTTITAYKSPMLKDIVYDVNQRSDNPLAEALLKMVGFQKKGDQTLEMGRVVVTENLRNKGFDTSALQYIDGSGLSRNHRVTPISQVMFLANQMKSSYYKDFFDSLPIAGQTGTLKRMFLGNSYGQIFAKTGTLNKVKTLAGYIKTRSGKTLAFSLLINNYSGSVDQVKNRMEQLLDPTLGL